MPKTRKYQKSNRKTRKTNKTRNKRIKKIKAKKSLKKQMLGGNGRKGRIEGTIDKNGKEVMLNYNGEGDEKLKTELKDGGLSELHTACYNGNLNKVIDFLKTSNVNEITLNYDMTPLYIASLTNHVDVVKKLLENPNIDVAMHTTYGETPLYVAINKNHKEVADLIKIRIGKNHDVIKKYWQYLFPSPPEPETVHSPLHTP